MKLSDKIHTAIWLLSRQGGPRHRFRLYRQFRRENARWRESLNWADRIRDAKTSSDNAHIPRVENSGQVIDGELIMHNGLRVGELSYDGEGPRSLMVANQGVHEPQEERVFQEILKELQSGATMLELGLLFHVVLPRGEQRTMLLCRT